jgi:hypothetical protein
MTLKSVWKSFEMLCSATLRSQQTTMMASRHLSARGPLKELLEHNGLEKVEVRAIDIPAAFQDFDDYWSPFLGGTGSAPKYCASLNDVGRERLRDELQQRLPTGPDGEILLAIRTWAAKGRVH